MDAVNDNRIIDEKYFESAKQIIKKTIIRKDI